MSDLWPSDELEHLGRCPVCGAERRTLAHEGLKDKLFNSSADAWSLYACDGCGVRYLDPRPTAESIGRAYAQYMTHEAPASQGQGSGNDGGSPARTVKRLLRALANGYRNARWGMQLEPHSGLGRLLVPCVPPLRESIDQQMRHLPGRPVPTGARLLDVGCGNGEFLQLARRAGWSVQGCDFDAAAVAAARSGGLDVRQGGLDFLQATEEESFDCITLSHVIEHVHEPALWLRELRRLVKPGGRLWLQTPNVESLGHARYGKDWRGLEPPRHLVLWTADTLRSQLRQAGFREVHLLSTPLFTAMEWYSASDLLRDGRDHAAFADLSTSEQRPLRHLWPALAQHRSTRRSEALTAIALR